MIAKLKKFTLMVFVTNNCSRNIYLHKFQNINERCVRIDTNFDVIEN